MALKIYFCDGCNESIPLKDINENKITIDAGKIFCAKCAPKNPVKEVGKSSPAFVAILVALVGLGFGLIAFITSQQIRDVGRDMGLARDEVSALRAEFNALRSDTIPRDEAESTRASTAEAVAGMQKELAAQSDRLKIYEGMVRTEVDSVEKKMGESMRNELTALAKQLATLSDEWRAHAGAEDALKASLVAVEGSIQQLRADLDAVRSQKTRGVSNGTDTSPSADALPDDASRDLILALKDQEAQRRFNAITELARFRTPAVVVALEGMLQDPESFVRDNAVRMLRRINAPSSIPAIIKALRDDDYFVRFSARAALKSMTNTDIAFDPAGEAAERESKVREWEGWWNLNSERLLRK